MKVKLALWLFLLVGIFDFVNAQQKQPNYASPYLQKENYIPIPGTENDINKTIHIAIHIWQRADGTGNLRDIPEHRARLYQVVDWINQLYSSNAQPIPKISYPIPFLDDSHLRVKLEGIYFYRDASPDSAYCYSTQYLHNKMLNDYVKKHFPERSHTLNIHLFRGHFASASGYSEDGSIGTFYRTNPEMADTNIHDWWLSKHWAHEIGHGLDLWHTYDRNSTYQQNCKEDYKDFLWDVFDTTLVSKTKGCDASLMTTHDGNNNLMGGQEGDYFSALQMGIAHRATVLENLYNKGYNMRDFVTGYSSTPKRIKKDETWDISMKIYQDIVVEEGKTLTIKTEIQMVPQAKIIVEPNAKLIVDGGKITNGKYYNKDWRGIVLRKRKKHVENSENGDLQLLNGGQVLHAKRIKKE